MRVVREWPFGDERLVLSKQERATMKRAAEIAERASAYFKEDGDAWLDWKATAMHCTACASDD